MFYLIPRPRTAAAHCVGRRFSLHLKYQLLGNVRQVLDVHQVTATGMLIA